MSTRSDGLVIVRHRVPYNGKGSQMLGSTVAAIVENHKYVQKIGPIEVGKSFIPIEELVPVAEAAAPLTLHEAIRRSSMEEYQLDLSLSPLKTLFDMYAVIQEEGLFPGYLVIGNKSYFQKWLGSRISHTKMSIFGTPVIEQEQLPESVFVLCGTDTRDPGPEDVKFSLKVTLP